jgi:hypothetical protein
MPKTAQQEPVFSGVSGLPCRGRLGVDKIIVRRCTPKLLADFGAGADPNPEFRPFSALMTDEPICQEEGFFDCELM